MTAARHQHTPTELRPLLTLAAALICANAAGADDSETIPAPIRLTALSSLKAQTEPDEYYQAPLPAVTAMIRGDMRTHRTPALAAVKAALAREFPARYDATVAAVAADKKYDPNGTLMLRDYLMRFCASPQGGRRNSFRAEAIDRNRRYLESPALKGTYEAVRRLLADEQFQEIRARLKDDRLYPRPAEIQDVESSRMPKENLAANLAQALAQQTLLLQEAETQVSALAGNLVASGLEQLGEQVRALDAEIMARSPEGILLELNGRLDQLVALRRAKPVAHRKAYEVFPRARELARHRATTEWDGRISAAVERVREEFALSRRTLDPALSARADAAIRKSPARHHSEPETTRLLDPIAKDALNQASGWVTAMVVDGARDHHSDADKPESLAGLSASVDHQIRDAASKAGAAWEKLEDKIRSAVKLDWKTLRKEFAGEQASDVAPALAAGNWTPSEDEIKSVKNVTISIPDLASLRVWKIQPPAEAAMLEEGWDQLTTNATNAISLGRRAIESQITLVNELRKAISDDIKNEPGLGCAHWVKAYEERSAAPGAGRPSSGNGRYPGLFKATRIQIEGHIARELDHVAKSTQAALVNKHFRAAKELIDAHFASGKFHSKDQLFEIVHRAVLDDWQKLEIAAEYRERLKKTNGLFEDTNVRINGRIAEYLTAVVIERDRVERGLGQVLIEAQQKAGGPIKDPQGFKGWLGDVVIVICDGRPMPGDMQEKFAKLSALADALILQNKLVDTHKEHFVNKITAEVQAGNPIEAGEWKRQYVAQVESVWKDKRPPNSPENLRVEVVERIGGIIDESINAARTTIADLALKRQQELVVNNQDGITAEILKDPAPQAEFYENKYRGLVQQGWEKARQDVSRFAKIEILPAIVDEIRGIVAQLIRESAAKRTPPKPPTVAGPLEADSRPTLGDSSHHSAANSGEQGPAENAQHKPDSPAANPAIGATPGPGDKKEGTGAGAGGPNPGGDGEGANHGKGGQKSVGVGGDIGGAGDNYPMPPQEQKAGWNPWLIIWLIILLLAIAAGLFWLWKRSRRGSKCGLDADMGVDEEARGPDQAFASALSRIRVALP